MAENPGIGKRWQDYRPSKSLWFWSCVACVVATMVVGFHWGGWVTGGTADDMAQSAGNKARAELAASLCVNRFESSADATTQLAALKKTDSWDRGGFIEKGGWVALPGVKQPVSGAADLCAQQLMTAKLPPAKTAAGTAG